MGVLGRTFAKGFRPCLFRNQPVQQFFGHLQAVMKEIDSSGGMENLFARPFLPGGELNAASEIEWNTDLSGDPVKYKDLSQQQQQQTGSQLMAAFEKIRAYAEARRGKTGIERDYSDYLQAVALTPDLNQVFVVGGKPVIVHWGFISETGQHPGQKMFAGWEEFIGEIQRKAPVTPAPKPPEKPAPETTQPIPVVPPPIPAQAPKPVPTEKSPVVTPHKPIEPSKPPVQERQSLACGLGEYQWVKWLAILLAIIILILLLLRLLPPRNPMGGQQMPGGMAGSGMSSGGGMPGGTPGGMPGGTPGGSSGGSGQTGGTPGNGAPGTKSFPGGTCPTCGTHPSGENPSGTPGGAPSGSKPEEGKAEGQSGSQSGSQQGSPVGGDPSTPPLGGKGGESKPDGKSPGSSDEKPGQDAGASSGESTSGKGKETEISFSEEGDADHVLVSRPPDPGTIWKILDVHGKPFVTSEAFFQKKSGQTNSTGDKVTLSLRPKPGQVLECTVEAISSKGSVSRYTFVTQR